MTPNRHFVDEMPCILTQTLFIRAVFLVRPYVQVLYGPKLPIGKLRDYACALFPKILRFFDNLPQSGSLPPNYPTPPTPPYQHQHQHQA